MQVDWVTNTAAFGKAYGVRGISSGRMPNFAQMLTPEQIQAIVDYERGL
jgi:mono/diheme cytochrome c family protein